MNEDVNRFKYKQMVKKNAIVNRYTITTVYKMCKICLDKKRKELNNM